MTQDITYTPFLKTEKVTEGNKELSFVYGPDYERRLSTYKVGGAVQETRYYGDDGYERFTDNTGAMQHLHYIMGGDGICAVIVRTGSTDEVFYVYKDHLGSWLTLTNASGSIVARQSFDAWGRRRNPATWNYAAIPAVPSWLNRGYTGHEHHDAFGLIHMNARMYDPLLGRMCAPDNLLHPQYGTQGFNRYSYVLNNPLKYTDPTGEFVWIPIAIGAAVGAYMGGTMANNNYNPGKWDFSSGRTWGWMAGGAIVGGISGGIGAAVASGGGMMANTMGIVSSSFINSVGTAIYTGGQTDVSVSFGWGSYNFNTGSFGYLGKKGNSALENIGYGFGALANLQDIMALNQGIDYKVNAHVTKDDLTGHSAGYNAQEGVDISVAGYNRHPYTKTTHIGQELEYLKNHFFPGEGRHYTGYDNSGWTQTLHNVNGRLLQLMNANLNKGRGLFGIGNLKYGFLFGCQSHVGRSLWAVGVPTIPINFHPWILNSQLFIREMDIHYSSFFINYYGR